MQTQRSLINFEGQNFFIGIDAHLKSWTITVMGESFSHKTFQQPPNVAALKSFLHSHFPGGNYYSVYEAGFCGFWAHYQLHDSGIKNIVVNPADVPTTQKEMLHKDDPVDSRKLARSLRSGELDGIYILEKPTIEERSLVRQRAAIVRDLTRIKQRVKMFLHYFGIEIPIKFSNNNHNWSKRFIIWLKEEVPAHLNMAGQTLGYMIEEVELLRSLLLKVTRAVQAMAKSEKYNKRMSLLRSIPGVGLLTAITFLVEIEDIKRFKNSDHFAGYVGLKPTKHSSGEKDKTGEMTFRGQKVLRKSLIESSWHAVRIDPVLSLSYKDYIQRMEPNNAIVRIARKVLNRMYFVLKNEQEYVSGVVK
jgi:transposase